MLLIDGVIRLIESGLVGHAVMDSGSPFFSSGKTPSYVCFELIAQCISAYSHLMGYNKGRAPSIGFILKVSSLNCFRPHLKENEEAIITIRQEAALPGGLFSFYGAVESGGEAVASGRLLVLSAGDASLQNPMEA